MNMTRVMAIFEKDYKEFMRNMMLFTSVLIPVVLAAFFGRLGADAGTLPSEMVIIIVGVVFTSVTFSGMMTMMAEENEKDTLRGLLQSPASILDIITGKSLVITLMTVISLAASIFLIDADGFWSLENIAGLILLGVFFLNLGIGIGLIVKSVATTSVYLIPIMFLFGFTPYIEFLVTEEGHIARQIAEYFPLYQNLYIYNGDGGAAEFLILLAWVAVSLGIVLWAFNRRKSDG